MHYYISFILEAQNGNELVNFGKLDVSSEPDTGVKAEVGAVFVAPLPCYFLSSVAVFFETVVPTLPGVNSVLTDKMEIQKEVKKVRIPLL